MNTLSLAPNFSVITDLEECPEDGELDKGHWGWS